MTEQQQPACEFCGLGPRHSGLRVCGSCFLVQMQSAHRKLHDEMRDPAQPEPVCRECGRRETPDEDYERAIEEGREAVAFCFIVGAPGWTCTDCAIPQDEGDEWKQ